MSHWKYLWFPLAAVGAPIAIISACNSVVRRDDGVGGGQMSGGTDANTTGASTSAGSPGSTGAFTSGPSDAGLYDGPVYDGDMGCAPTSNGFVETSCCEGTPCEGSCELHDGSWQCYCAGISGGCASQGLRCCPVKKGCTNEESCTTTP
jgi:hypothetical protein